MGFEISTTLMSLNAKLIPNTHTHTQTYSKRFMHKHKRLLLSMYCDFRFLILRAYGFLVYFIPFSFDVETNIFSTLLPFFCSLLAFLDSICQNFGSPLRFSACLSFGLCRCYYSTKKCTFHRCLLMYAFECLYFI